VAYTTPRKRPRIGASAKTLPRAGAYLADGDSVVLHGVAAPAKVFASWTGDTTSLNPVLS